MSVFDVLFLVLALTTAIALAGAGAVALAGRSGASLRILRRVGMGALLYFAVVIAVSVVAPRRLLRLGDAQCFDDWCVAATSAQASGASYVVDLRISSRALRVSQRELNVAVYLSDRDGRRYEATPQPGEVPFSVLLEPGQTVDMRRVFDVPRGTGDVNLIITHEGGFPIGWLIVGYDSWFRKPPLIY
jgi:hypothetical protein